MSIAFVMSLASASCLTANQGDDDSEPIEQMRAQVRRENGFQLNGFQLNGFQLNGFQLNGFQLNGFQLNGFQLNGFQLNGILISGLSINGVQISGAALGGVSVNSNSISIVMPGTGKVLSGADLKGLTVYAVIPEPTTQKPIKYTFRVDSVVLDSSNKNVKDVWLYQISYQLDGMPNWQAICRDYGGNPAPAILVKGSYWNEVTGARVDDANSGTLACYEGAVGKCISAGYRPWATAQQCTGSGKSKKCTTVSLKDHHQACTRMMRADYCGDGKSYTVNGTVLDIFDYLQPPVQLQEEKWQMEARWTPTGASCLTERRHEEIAFPGCKGRKLKECEAYCASSDRGLVVSTFNDGTPVKK
jgi:hypothetical protein